MKLVNRLRDFEIKEYWKGSLIRVLAYTINVSGQGVVILITFIIYVNNGGVLRYSNIYCGASILLVAHTLMTGSVAMGMMQSGLYISTCNRTKEALLSQEIKPLNKLEHEVGAISFIDVNSSWYPICERIDPKATNNFIATIDNIDDIFGGITFKIEPRELCAIVGSVGSGKSKLLQTILGETFTSGGEIKIGGSVAYVEQEPWIINGSIRRNILMGQPYDQVKYESVLNCCCLLEDLNAMTHGDLTNVGEHGCTLSGGQKARIALARAVYSDKDIYLLDDPFSAIDSRVAENILKLCIKGRLKRKTIIMVTNHLYFLPFCSKILLMDNSRVIYEGNYDGLRKEEWALEMLGKSNVGNTLEENSN